MGRSKGPLGPVLHTFVFAGPKGTLFGGALVTQLLPYQHHPDAVCALVACDHILAAHPLFRGAAGGHAPLALGAAACVGAGGIGAQAHAVGRGCHILHPGNGLLQVADNLVHTGHHNHPLGAVNQGGHPVAVAVHVVQLALLGDGVGAGEEHVRGEGAAVHLLGVHDGPVQKLIGAAFQQILNAALRQRHRPAAGDHLAGGKHPPHGLHGLLPGGRVRGGNPVLGQGFDGALYLGAAHRFQILIHRFLLPYKLVVNTTIFYRLTTLKSRVGRKEKRPPGKFSRKAVFAKPFIIFFF